MHNLQMLTALRTGQALDVLREGRMIQPGLYQLKRFIEDKEYCDPRNEWWISSIGKSVFDNRIMAATDSRFYGDPNWECLFLR